jgi:hypothetical protein
MRRSGTRVLLTAAAVASVVGIAQAPAMAAPSARATISISAKSALKPITGKVLVVFRAGKFASGHIKGTARGGASGQVLQLFAQQFPFKKAPVKLDAPITLASASRAYSFKVTPTLATRYHVELFTDSSETTRVGKSAVQNLYVAAFGRFTGLKSCANQRPVCRQRIHVTVTVPPSTLATERHKAWHPYFGLTLRSSGRAPRPKTLKLNGGHAHVVGTKKLNSQQYQATITYSFRIGNNSSFFVIAACQKDTESTDGLNLPGRHSCGNKVISSKLPYLG